MDTIAAKIAIAMDLKDMTKGLTFYMATYQCN
jgi:hypothetical protein